MSTAIQLRRAVLGVLPIIVMMFGYQEVCMSQATARAGSRTLCSYTADSWTDRVGRGLRPSQEGWFQRDDRPESNNLVGRRRRRDQARARHTDRPAILVGHSYGGVVITEAGNDTKVAGLVYIAAFAPDKGESVSFLIKNHRRARRCRRSCRRKTDTSSLIARSSEHPSPRMSARQPHRSWRIRRCRGALRLSTALSPNPPGRRSQAGTSSRPKTR